MFAFLETGYFAISPVVSKYRYVYGGVYTNMSRNVRLYLCLAIIGSAMCSAQTTLPSARGDIKRQQGCISSMLAGGATTGSDFTVTVKYRGRPMPDVSLVLSPGELADLDSPKRIIRKTDSNGIVQFHGIRRGEYSLLVNELVAPSWTVVTVKANPRKSDSGFSITWPTVRYVVRAPNGRVFHENAIVPMNGVVVQLLELRTSKVLATVRSDFDGNYNLPIPINGVYVVRYNYLGELQDYQDVGVEISDGARNEHLPMLKLGGCGISPKL